MWRPDATMSETPCTLNEGQCTLIYSGHCHVRAMLGRNYMKEGIVHEVAGSSGRNVSLETKRMGNGYSERYSATVRGGACSDTRSSEEKTRAEG